MRQTERDMKRTRRKIDAAVKAKIALEAVREQEPALRTWRSATRSTRTRFTRGRSSCWSRLHGPLTPVPGRMPRQSGTGRSRSYMRRSVADRRA